MNTHISGGGGGGKFLNLWFVGYGFAVPSIGRKDQDPVQMLENSMLVCSLFLLEFQ